MPGGEGQNPGVPARPQEALKTYSQKGKNRREAVTQSHGPEPSGRQATEGWAVIERHARLSHHSPFADETGPGPHQASRNMKGQNRMRAWTKKIVRFLQAEDGPTAVEYAVMLALIIVVCITAITTLGTNANKTFSTVALTTALTSSSPAFLTLFFQPKHPSHPYASPPTSHTP